MPPYIEHISGKDMQIVKFDFRNRARILTSWIDRCCMEGDYSINVITTQYYRKVLV